MSERDTDKTPVPATWDHYARECLVCSDPQAVFRKPHKSQEPGRCVRCGGHERGDLETNGSFANNGHGVERPVPRVGLEPACTRCGSREGPVVRGSVDNRCFDVFACEERCRLPPSVPAMVREYEAATASHGIEVGDTVILEPCPADCAVCAAQPVEPAATPIIPPEQVKALMEEGRQLSAEFRARIRPMTRPWEPPVVMPGATTALQARADELAAALAAAREQTEAVTVDRRKLVDMYEGKLADLAMDGVDMQRQHADELARVTRAFAETVARVEKERDDEFVRHEGTQQWAAYLRANLDARRAELAVTRDHLLACIEHATDYLGGEDEHPVIASARAALDSTAPAPRPAIEALVAAVNRAIANAPVNMGDGAAPWALPTLADWDAVIAAKDEYEKERQS